MTLDGKRILIFAGDLPFLSDIFGGDAHVAIIERIGQRADHGVHDLAGIHALTPAHARQPILRAAHVFRTAGHNSIGIAHLDHLRARDDSLQTAAAQAVQSERGRFDG